MRTRLSIAAVALGAAALIGGAAWACVPGASIAVNPGTGGPGTSVTVTGTTFDSGGSPVNIYWDGTAGAFQGQAAVLPDRTFSFTFQVPAGATNGAHVVSATQLDRNGLAYNPVNRSFRVSGGAAATRTAVPQGVAVPEPADGVAAPAPAPQPVAQPAPRAAAAPAPAPAPAQPGSAAPGGPAVGSPASPGTPVPPGGEAQQGVTSQQPAGSQEAFGASVPAPAPAGAGEAAASSGGGAPAWLLIPLAVLSLGFLGAGSGIFMRERKRARVPA